MNRPVPDEEREVPIDDAVELELPPQTLDPAESIEDDTDDEADQLRETAIELGEIDPDA